MSILQTLVALERAHNQKEHIDVAVLLNKWQAKTYYEIIGVSASSTFEEIKSSCNNVFMEYCKKFHPDKFNFANDPVKYRIVTELFKLVSAARTTLSDQNSKRQYDAELQVKINYSETFPGEKSAKQAKMPTQPAKSPALPDDKWQAYYMLAEEFQVKFLRDNPDKLESPFYSQIHKKEVTPFEFICRVASQEAAPKLNGLKQLLLNGVKIPFISADDSSFIQKALNSLIYSSADLEVQRASFMTNAQLVELTNQQPHLLGYLDKSARTCVLYASVSQFNFLVMRLAINSIGDISYLKSVSDNRYRLTNLSSALICYANNDRPTSDMMKFLHSFISENSATLSCLDVRYYYKDEKTNAIKALFACGFLPSGAVVRNIKRLKNESQTSLILKYLTSLPEQLLNLSEVVECLQRSFGFLGMPKEITHVIHTCFLKKVQSEDDLLDEQFATNLVNYTIAAIEEVLNGEEFLKDNYAKYRERAKLNFQLVLLFYGLPSRIAVTPITAKLATQILLKNNNTAAFIVHFGASGQYCVTTFDNKNVVSTISLLDVVDRDGSSVINKQQVIISPAEIANSRTQQLETVLHLLAKEAQANPNVSIVILKLLEYKEIQNILNAKDAQGQTALYYAAQCEFMRDACMQLVALGATANMEINEFVLAPFSKISYIPNLIKQQRLRAQQPRELPSLARKTLDKFQAQFTQQENPNIPNGALNLDILKGNVDFKVPLTAATQSTLACALLRENVEVARALLFHGMRMSPIAFKIAMLTENKAVIDLAFESTYPDQIPNLANITPLCRANIQQYIARILEDRLKHAKPDEELLNRLFEEVLQSTVSQQKEDIVMAEPEQVVRMIM